MDTHSVVLEEVYPAVSHPSSASQEPLPLPGAGTDRARAVHGARSARGVCCGHGACHGAGHAGHGSACGVRLCSESAGGDDGMGREDPGPKKLKMRTTDKAAKSRVWSDLIHWSVVGSARACQPEICFYVEGPI